MYITFVEDIRKADEKRVITEPLTKKISDASLDFEVDEFLYFSLLTKMCRRRNTKPIRNRILVIPKINAMRKLIEVVPNTQK